MAFAFSFPRDVTDLIYSMRDWRWEMVRDGGKTPSARRVNGKPTNIPLGEPLTARMIQGKEYVIPCPELPSYFACGGSCGISRTMVPNCEEHPDNRMYGFFGHSGRWNFSINVWKYTSVGYFGRPGWEIINEFRPYNHDDLRPNAAELFERTQYECEPCLPNNEVPAFV